MPANSELLGALKTKMRVGYNPDLHPSRRHGTVWFEVSGFGKQSRDFTVNRPDVLVLQPRRFAEDVAKQLMLIDPSLPKNERICKPILIDVTFGRTRRIMDMTTMQYQFDQS